MTCLLKRSLVRTVTGKNMLDVSTIHETEHCLVVVDSSNIFRYVHVTSIRTFHFGHFLLFRYHQEYIELNGACECPKASFQGTPGRYDALMIRCSHLQLGLYPEKDACKLYELLYHPFRIYSVNG